MVKCPECEAEIDHLDVLEAWEKVYVLHADGEYKLIEEAPSEFLATQYRCPECEEVLFEDEDEALAFLRGESVESLSTK